MPAATITALPPEMIAEITSHLHPRAVANLRLTCHALYALTRPPPPLSKRAWRRFHHDFELGARLTKDAPLPLACTRCMRVLPPSRFQDSQAKRRCDRLEGRVCFRCGVLKGYYNVRDFMHGKEPCFSCFGCAEPRLRAEEAAYDAAGPRVLADEVGFGPVDRGGRRWCKECWRVITMYVNSRLVV